MKDVTIWETVNQEADLEHLYDPDLREFAMKHLWIPQFREWPLPALYTLVKQMP